jgi:hypothetical protein
MVAVELDLGDVTEPVRRFLRNAVRSCMKFQSGLLLLVRDWLDVGHDLTGRAAC